MFFRRALAAFFLSVSLSFGADLQLLDGKTITGDLVSISEKEIVMKVEGKDVATSVEDVLAVELKSAGKLNAPSYIDVELIDGTLLHCSQVTPKKKEVTLTLVGGQEVKVPLETLSWLLKDAQDAKSLAWFKTQVAKTRTSDLLAVKTKDGAMESLNGTFGDADDEGKTIEFDLESGGNPRPLKLEKAAGIVWLRKGAGMVKPTRCKLFDTQGNVVLVHNVTVTKTGYSVETPSGAKIEYGGESVARIDYSKGKLTYLSEVDPSKVVESSALDRVEHYRRNKNLDGGAIRLGGQIYNKGLALHAYTELEYDLGGEYREFRATVGVNDLVGGSEGGTVLKIEGDGKELFNETISRKDKPKPITLNVKDVRKLKIIVSSPELLDLGKHLDLADAKVSK